jgi:hypothetical protein
MHANAALGRSMIARRRWFTYWVLKSPAPFVRTSDA